MTRPVLLSEHSRIALMHESGLTPPRKAPQFIAAFVSTLSAVCLGMVFSWSSSAIPILEKEFAITTAQGAWVGSLVTLGAFVGAIPAGPMAQLTGRKRALQILIIPLLSSWILIAFFCKYIWVLYIARFLAGISSGGISVAAPMYVTELAHVSIRGTLGTFFQVQITIGILFEYLLGDIISDIRTLSLISAVLPVVFLLSFAFIPESPVYLCEKAKLQDAQRSLLWFRGKDYEIDDELVKITEDIEESKRNKTKLFEIFKCKATYKGLIISFGLMAFQQLSGVNAVLFYTNKIFQQSGGSLSPGQCSILVGAVQVIASLITTVLIDRAGRKILLTVSSLAMSICLAALGLYFYFSNFMNLRALSFVPLVSVTGFMASFSIGFGPIPWMIMGEILSPKSRTFLSSLAASINWLLAFLITNQFANLVNFVGIGPTFLGFSVICGLSTIFVLSLVEETKGRSQKEVAHILAGNYQSALYSETLIIICPDIEN
ncbi:facilitated trehalose transporter Tret1 isoform X1 [Dendroctonus ponderosae]|uniref:facilitated trehalose transporter Tret1 isoform X1 n=1 Tax=Dendroctonus ponderosae TaxID=77166 RepID=UPI002034CF29|nr:facilitated trehalose transporter Tret1 isoform X1 [Dendroctonus ponderosae]